MKITRTPLRLNSLLYSREWDVDRSTGVHLMTIVEYIGQGSGLHKKYADRGTVDLEPFATAGFAWEHVMSRTQKLEHSMSFELMRMEMVHRPELEFPGERFWCRQCNKFMTAGSKGRARKHCRRRKHTGIYFTPDAFDTNERAYVEWKFNWSSSKKSHPNVLNSRQGIWKWPVQCMFNALGLGTDRAYMQVLHCMGDYQKGMPKPAGYRIDFQFTQRELMRNKMMIVENAIDNNWI